MSAKILPTINVRKTGKRFEAEIIGGKGYDTISEMLDAAWDEAGNNFEVNVELDALYGRLDKLLIMNTSLKTLADFQLEVTTLSIQSNKSISKFENMSHAKVKNIKILELRSLHEGLHFNSLEHCHKHLPKALESMSIAPVIEHGFLGFILLPNMKMIENLNSNRSMARACSILNQHFAGDRDLMETQEELIQAGLKQYARV